MFKLLRIMIGLELVFLFFSDDDDSSDEDECKVIFFW